MQGRAPYKFMPAFNMSLFLSANDADVRQAVGAGHLAGTVLPSSIVDDPDDRDLRIAFGFDGVLDDDSSEQIFKTDGLEGFREHASVNVMTPLGAGPLRDFLANINRIQDREEARHLEDASYQRRLHVSIITARNAPAHARAVESLKSWGVRVNDAFFLGAWTRARSPASFARTSTSMTRRATWRARP